MRRTMIRLSKNASILTILLVAVLTSVGLSCKQKNRSLEPIDSGDAGGDSANSEGEKTEAGISTAGIDVFAVIESAPSGVSRASKVSMRVAGSGIQEFIYKVGPSVTTDCGLGSGYTLHPVGEFELDLSAVPDGEIRLCVVGRHETGAWQDYGNASSVTWVKDTGQLAVPAQFNQIPAASKLSLFWDAVPGAEGYMLARSRLPIDWQPKAGESYTIGSPAEGVILVQVNSELSFIDEAVEDANSYHYALFAFDVERRYSAALTLSAIPGADPYAWIKLEPGAYTEKAVAAGTRFDGSRNLYLCRGRHLGPNGEDLGLHPGKFVPAAKGNLNSGACYYAYGGFDEEDPNRQLTFAAQEFELLVITRGSFDDWFTWMAVNSGSTPPAAGFAAGMEPPARDLFACRYPNGPDDYMVVGKSFVRANGLLDTCQADIFPTRPALGTAAAYELLLLKQP